MRRSLVKALDALAGLEMDPRQPLTFAMLIGKSLFGALALIASIALFLAMEPMP